MKDDGNQAVVGESWSWELSESGQGKINAGEKRGEEGSVKMETSWRMISSSV